MRNAGMILAVCLLAVTMGGCPEGVNVEINPGSDPGQDVNPNQPNDVNPNPGNDPANVPNQNPNQDQPPNQNPDQNANQPADQIPNQNADQNLVPAQDPGQNQNQPPNNVQPTIQGADELAFMEAMCRGARDARSIAQTRAVNAMFNVFTIAGFANAYPVVGGTLTLNNVGSAIAYDANPADHVVVVSPSETVEYFYQQFNGDGSSLLNFINNHNALVVRVVKAGAFDLTITSIAGAGNTQRHSVGSVTLPRSVAQVDIVDGLGTYYDFALNQTYNFNIGITVDIQGFQAAGASSIRGSVQAAGGTITVDEVFDSKIVNNVLQTKVLVSSTGQRNGANYALGNVYFQHVERNGLKTEPDYWYAWGNLYRGAAVLGTAQFVDAQPAPVRAMVLIDGTQLGM